MQNQYNFYNLEASFKNYLLAVNKKITVKNYLSDFRHFLGWLILEITSQLNNHKIDENPTHFISLINTEIISNYKSYLTENKIPFKTINRRLSTVRKFCSFCISQGWMKENPGKKISNINLSVGGQSFIFKSKKLLNQFEKDLIKAKINQSTVNSYLNDLQEFLLI